MHTREVGKVTVVRCTGRVAAGQDNESLRVHISGMFRDRKDFVLHLGEVAFIDSSGLGTMVRLLTSARQLRGDLKLCNLPPMIDKTLKTTNLSTLFDTHESEESAISAFYRRGAEPKQAASQGRPVVCIDQNGDVLAYLREFLRRNGYDVHTSNSLQDSSILIRVLRPVLLVLGPNLTASPAARQAFDAVCAKIPIIELGHEFSTLDAGEAASRLLQNMQLCLASSA
jgi:anti-sigma B factor antagonist